MNRREPTGNPGAGPEAADPSLRTLDGEELLALLASLPRPDEKFLAIVERIGREQPPIQPLDDPGPRDPFSW